MNNMYYMDMYSNNYYRTDCVNDYPVIRNNVFYSDNEGFIKGNIEKNIYLPYRNYNPSMPQVNNDRDRLLLEIQKHGFVLIDLGLYLDLHPQDKEALKQFNENKVKYCRLISEFTKNYYPLMFMDGISSDSYKWLEGKFPFAGGN